MKYSDLKVLVVDKQIEDANNFIANLAPEFEFECIEVVRSPHKGIQAFLSDNYDLCFVADLFSEEEVESFVNDLKSVPNSGTCVLVHLRLSIPANERRDSYIQRGFPFIISREGSELDKDGLKKTITKLIKDKEIKKRVLNIDDAMKVALRKIDEVAEAVKRSSRTKLSLQTFPMEFMELQTEYDEKVLEEYYEVLEKQTETAEADNVTYLYIPEDVLGRRHFPELSQSGYRGVSSRVWKRLKNKFGVTHDNKEDKPKPNPELTSESIVANKIADGCKIKEGKDALNTKE